MFILRTLAIAITIFIVNTIAENTLDNYDLGSFIWGEMVVLAGVLVARLIF